MSTSHAARPLLSERLRVSLSAVAAVVVAVLTVWCYRSGALSAGDATVLVMLGYLVTYLTTTVITFDSAPHEEILTWAERESRGSFVERYILGSAPGPGVSLFFALAALWVAVIWLPGVLASEFSLYGRLAIALTTVSAAWSSVVVSFAVTFYADNVVEDEQGLAVPDAPHPQWSDYVYFALSVMTTFGTTDITVRTAPMRRTVVANSVIAFVFNSFVVAALVTTLTAAT